MAPEELPHWVYELIAADGMRLYVGCTENIGVRLGQHRRGRPWWGEVRRIEIDVFPDMGSALEVERSLIETHQPAHSFQHTNRSAKAEADRLVKRAERVQEVTRLSAQGLSLRQIAEVLRISHQTAAVDLRTTKRAAS